MLNQDKESLSWIHRFNNVGGINTRNSIFTTPKTDCLSQRNIDLVSGGFKKANGLTRFVQAPILASGTYLRGTIDPTTESDAWTGAGDATTISFSGGIMTNDESAGASGFQIYFNAEAGFTTGTDATAETRFKVRSGGTLSGVYASSPIVLDDGTKRCEISFIESSSIKSIALLATPAARTLIGSYSNLITHDWTNFTRIRVSLDASADVSVFIDDMESAAFTIAYSALPASTETSRVAHGSFLAATVIISDLDYLVYKIGSTSLDTKRITGIYEFEDKSGTFHKVITAGANLYKFNSSTSDWDLIALGTNFTTNADVFFTVGREDTSGDAILIMTTSARNTPQKFDGTTAADLGGSPPSGKYCAIFNDRAFISNTSGDTTSLFFSALGNSEDRDSASGTWDTANDVIIPDRYVYGEVTQTVPLGGAPDQGNVLLIFFERGIKRLTGWGKGSFLLETISARHGCTSPKSIVIAPLGPNKQEVCFFRSNDGYYMTNGEIGSVLRVSEKILPSLRDDVLSSSIANEVAWYNPERSLIGWSYNTLGGAQNDDSWGFDYFHASRPSEEIPGGIAESWGFFDYAANAAGRYRESVGKINTVIGTYDGLVYVIDSGTTHDNSDYQGFRETAWEDADSPERVKQWRYLVLYLQATGDHNLTTEWAVNWNDTFVNSELTSLLGESFILGTGILGVTLLGTVGSLRKKFELNVTGNSIKIKFSTLLKDQQFSLYGYSIGYQFLDWMDSNV